MKGCRIKSKAFRFRIYCLWSLIVIVLTGSAVRAQSTDQSYPTPITTNEISGEIKARDIGDSRVTTYFYTFDGSQGDLFVNIVSRNFNGDIDIFTLRELRPLTKVVVYADLSENETGRVIYLRKPENLLLRVQGRTPNDDPATFRVKFAGSFVASTREPGPAGPELPKVSAESASGIRVNSVGTIIERPKPTPSPADAVAVTEEVKPEPAEIENKAEVTAVETPPAEPTAEPEKAAEPEKKVGVVVTDNLPSGTKATPAKSRRTARNRGRTTTRKNVPPKVEESSVEAPPADTSAAADPAVTAETKPAAETEQPAATEKAEPADPLANVRLVVIFKDGKRIERPMTEVFRFTVDKGILTVVSKDGRIGRYPLLDISEVTIK